MLYYYSFFNTFRNAAPVWRSLDLFFSMRGGNLKKFLARELVPGDIIHITVGDRIPADMRLYEVSINDLRKPATANCF